MLIPDDGIAGGGQLVQGAVEEPFPDEDVIGVVCGHHEHGDTDISQDVGDPAEDADQGQFDISDEEYVEVVSGLEKGEKVVTKGYEWLRNRSKVRIMK